MGMLEQMRSGSDSTFMQVVMALVVISFIGWYAKPQGDTNGVVAEINGHRIMETDFRRVFVDRVRQEEMMNQGSLSDSQQSQLSTIVKNEMIQKEVALQEARAMGLTVSDMEVARAVLSSPVVRNEEGKFDEALYQRFLKRASYTRDEYEEKLREELLFQKAIGLVRMGANLSEPALREAYIEQETKLELLTVQVRPTAFLDQIEPTDAELDAYIAENSVTLKERYDRDFQRLYNKPEQVELRMIRLAVQLDGLGVAELLPRLRELRAQVEAGADFSELAKKWSEDPSVELGGSLGLKPVVALPSDVQAELAGLEMNGMTKALAGENDVRLFQLVQRVPASVDTLEMVQRDVARALLVEEKAPVLAASFADEELLPKWKELGAPPEDLLGPLGLVVVPSGPLSVARRASFGPPAAMLQAASRATVGSVLPSVYQEQGALWVGQLDSRIEADMTAFEAEKDMISESVLYQRRMEFMQGWLSDAVATSKID